MGSERDRQVFCQRLFREVLELSKTRVLSRIRPHWVQKPSHVRKERPSLQSQIQRSLRTLRDASGRTPKLQLLLKTAEELVDCLEPLNHVADGNDMNKMLETVINKCAEMATVGDERSVRDHLRSLSLPHSLCEAPEVHQIDKLARYHFICRDLIRIARKPEYGDLLKHIDITYINAFPGVARPGIGSQCFVHAEIQQALHYEKYPHEPAPRVIGCSKSACYLCDLFVLKQNRYRVSHAHRRLYEKWTIPDVNWMTEGQVVVFRSIVQAMIQDLRAKISNQRRIGGRQPWRPYPLESRAFLPLSSGSTLSVMTGHQGIRAKTSTSERKPPNHLKITGENLPFYQSVRPGQSLDIDIDRLSLSFDFISLSSGYLSISRIKDPSGCQIITASDIPTNKEMKLKFSQESSQIGFCIQLTPGFPLEIDFHWGKTEAEVIGQR